MSLDFCYSIFLRALRVIDLKMMLFRSLVFSFWSSISLSEIFPPSSGLQSLLNFYSSSWSNDSFLTKVDFLLNFLEIPASEEEMVTFIVLFLSDFIFLVFLLTMADSSVLFSIDDFFVLFYGKPDF